MSSNNQLDCQSLEGTWLEIEQLAEQLHCSTRLIYELKNERVLVPGNDFYTLGSGKVRGKHVYCLERCRAALLKRTAELAKQKAQTQSIQPVETYNEDHLIDLVAKGGR